MTEGTTPPPSNSSAAVPEFHAELLRRIAEAGLALVVAIAAVDVYAADVRRGELDSLLHLAREHGINLEGKSS